jgi:hypothetical protein
MKSLLQIEGRINLIEVFFYEISCGRLCGNKITSRLEGESGIQNTVTFGLAILFDRKV